MIQTQADIEQEITRLREQNARLRQAAEYELGCLRTWMLTEQDADAKLQMLAAYDKLESEIRRY